MTVVVLFFCGEWGEKVESSRESEDLVGWKKVSSRISGFFIKKGCNWWQAPV